MNPNRRSDPNFSRNELHLITSSLRIVISGFTGTTAYSPLSFCGPSRSIPIVLPSRENEWQFAHVCRPVISSRLCSSPTFRNRHAISGTAAAASGLITPFSSSDGISGTSL